MKATNKETIKYIVDNYYNFSIKELIEYSKLSPSTILKIAKNNNLLLKSAKKYVCNENYFGVQLLDKSFEKDGFSTSIAALNKSEYFHQKAITSGKRGEVENTQMIAAYFPMLIN